MGKLYRSNRTGGPPQAAPVNVSVPVLSGTATLGQVLSTTDGVWTSWPRPTFTYRWIRGAATVIAGATGSTYTIVAGDQTQTVKAEITASNQLGAVVALSAPTGTIP